MSRYAENTSVSSERSRAEIVQTVSLYGAAILKDGQPLTIEQILEELRERDALAALFFKLQGAATDLIHASKEEEAGDAKALDAVSTFCPDCEGDGNIAYTTCPICDGAGTLSAVEDARLYAERLTEQIDNCELECGNEGHQ